MDSEEHLEGGVDGTDCDATGLVGNLDVSARVVLADCLGFSSDEGVVMIGVKADGEKTRWDLMQWGFLDEVAKVVTFGARKYSPDNWKKVPMGRARYFAAGIRHMAAWWGGEQLDRESGCHHLAHATCCLMFLVGLERQKTGGRK